MEYPRDQANERRLRPKMYHLGIEKPKLKRPSRAKKHLPWEEIDIQSHGFYAERLHLLIQRFPALTKMELRVAALVSAMLSSREIAERLKICEESVENHRINIRRKIGLNREQDLQKFLITIF